MVQTNSKWQFLFKKKYSDAFNKSNRIFYFFKTMKESRKQITVHAWSLKPLWESAYVPDKIGERIILHIVCSVGI